MQSRPGTCAMVIRPYAEEDFEAVVALWRRVMAETYTYLTLHTESEDRAYFRDVIVKENELQVAEAGDGVVGYLALREDVDDLLFIDRLYIDVGRQRAGVGTALLDHVKGRAAAGLRLYTHQKNRGACRFYERRGFVAVRYGMSPPPENEPDVEYRWASDRDSDSSPRP